MPSSLCVLQVSKVCPHVWFGGCADLTMSCHEADVWSSRTTPGRLSVYLSPACLAASYLFSSVGFKCAYKWFQYRGTFASEKKEMEKAQVVVRIAGGRDMRCIQSYDAK